MSKKNARSGGKYGGNHTTVIPAATIVCDIVEACLYVTKISPGFIKAGLPSAHGKRRVKITQKGGAILLSIRDNTSHQEIYVYATDVPKALETITRGLGNLHLEVSGEK